MHNWRPGCAELLAQYNVCNDVDPSSDAYVSELRVNVAKTSGSVSLVFDLHIKSFGEVSLTLVLIDTYVTRTI